METKQSACSPSRQRPTVSRPPSSLCQHTCSRHPRQWHRQAVLPWAQIPEWLWAAHRTGLADTGDLRLWLLALLPCLHRHQLDYRHVPQAEPLQTSTPRRLASQAVHHRVRPQASVPQASVPDERRVTTRHTPSAALERCTILEFRRTGEKRRLQSILQAIVTTKGCMDGVVERHTSTNRYPRWIHDRKAIAEALNELN